MTMDVAAPLPVRQLLVEVKNVTSGYGKHTAIEDFSLSIEPGQHTLLLGPSGSGKTTLLLMLAGLLPPSKGIVRVNGDNVYQLPEAARDRWRGQNAGIIFQTLHLLPTLTVAGNLELARYAAGLAPDPKTMRALLYSLGIARLEARKPRRLSQGQIQRVGIARALINHPPLVLADEPTAALDDENCQAVCNLLLDKASSTGATLVIATHDKRLIDAFPQHVLLPKKEFN
jgi:ABC-type lipoprotein export system ATPase subunit